MANMNNLIAQFQSEWRPGNDARVHLKCHAGQAWLSLHLYVQHPPLHQEPRHLRQPGPSRFCRRGKAAPEAADARAAVTGLTNNYTETQVISMAWMMKWSRILKPRLNLSSPRFPLSLLTLLLFMKAVNSKLTKLMLSLLSQ